MLHHGARKHQVDRGVIQWQLVGVVQDDRDPRRVGDIDGQVVELRVIEERAEAAVHVGSADIDDGDALLLLEWPAFHVAAVALVHVFKRGRVH